MNHIPKNIRGKFHFRVFTKDIRGFAAHQENRTYSLGNKITFKPKTNNDATIRAVATANAKLPIKIKN